MKAIVESHGGTVEKFIGDAVMAVFGIPAAHEDDAAGLPVEMRDALPGSDRWPHRREHGRGGHGQRLAPETRSTSRCFEQAPAR
jgi:class 3 adenylate cyclase